MAQITQAPGSTGGTTTPVECSIVLSLGVDDTGAHATIHDETPDGPVSAVWHATDRASMDSFLPWMQDVLASLTARIGAKVEVAS